jgi:chromate transport protein ChrA
MLITVLGSLYRTKNADPSWAAGWPVALYAGWLSAASFVSIGLLLAGYGILSEVLAAIVALTLATAFALYHQAKLKHWTYGTAVIWGFVAIAINNFGSQTLLVILALSAVALIGGLIAWQRKALF